MTHIICVCSQGDSVQSRHNLAHFLFHGFNMCTIRHGTIKISPREKERNKHWISKENVASAASRWNKYKGTFFLELIIYTSSDIMYNASLASTLNMLVTGLTDTVAEWYGKCFWWQIQPKNVLFFPTIFQLWANLIKLLLLRFYFSIGTW